MLFQIESPGKFSIIAPEGTAWSGKRLRAELRACTNPVCRCEEVEVTLSAEMQLLGEVSLQVYEKEVLPPLPKIASPLDPRISRAIASGMDEADWKWLREEYLRIKREATSRINSATEEVLPFPMAKDIERYSELVPYEAILPYAEAFWTGDERNGLLFDDQYCLQPDCQCTEAFATFIHFQDMKQVEGEPAGIFLDYETGEVRIEHQGEPEQDIDALLDRVQQQFPNLAESLRDRHATLRTLYRNFRARTSSPAPAAPKVGRNDPCPCGSGKKFKRCCLP
jgi:SEC-C motif